MKAIGIDIGTTTISGVVVEVDERRHSTVIEARTIQNGSFIGTSNEWERIQDAEKIIQKAKVSSMSLLINIRMYTILV